VPGVRGFAGVSVALLPGPLTTLPGSRAPPWRRVKVAAVRVAVSITLLKLATTGALMATAVAFAAGLMELTAGGMIAAVVVKLQERLAEMLAPAADMAPVLMVAVNRLLGARGLEGAKVAVRPSVLFVTAPEIGEVPCTRVKVVPLSGLMAMLKVTDGLAPSATSVAPFPGERVLIKGAGEVLGQGFGASFPLQANSVSVTRETPTWVQGRAPPFLK